MQNTIGQAATGFIIIALTSQVWHVLPPTVLVLGTIGLLALSTLLYRFWRQYPASLIPMLVGGAIGFIWFASVGHWYAAWQLPNEEIQQDVIIQGEILSASFNQYADKYTIALHHKQNKAAKGNIRVSWYRNTWRFKKGQLVKLCVRLKPPRGLQNPHGFDYWRWLVSQRVVATGYVRECEFNALLKPATSFTNTLITRLKALQLPGEKWLMALMLADRSQFETKDWQTLQHFGISHLFALSGLHMGVVFAICFWLSRLLWFSISGLLAKANGWNLSVPIVFTTVLFAIGYVALCGMPLTLTRAWLLMTVFSFALATNGYIKASQLFKLVLVLCLLLFPFSIYGLSLYLSFGAVATILFLTWLFPHKNKGKLSSILYVVKIQVLLCGIMMGSSAFVFGSVYWAAPLANLVIIPFITVVVVPACFIGLILLSMSPAHASYMLEPIGTSLSYLVGTLEGLSVPSWDIYAEWQVWVCLLFTIAVLLLPPIPKKRVAVVCLMLSAVLQHTVKPHFESVATQWGIDVYDVGQGSALVLHNQQAAMLIDTGPSYASGFSMAEAVLEPNLSRLYPNKAFTGILTHSDNDHAGGSGYLVKKGLVKTFRKPYEGCTRGQTWTVGSVNIAVLWPNETAKEWSSNNRSCVLLAEYSGIRVLITGDIEAEAEKALLSLGDELAAHILVSPHHGSKSSSSQAFINAVSPQYVIFTTGYLNRWGFPHDEVVRRYEHTGATIVNTAKDGFIRFHLGDMHGRAQIQVETWKEDLQPRWYKSLSMM